MSSVLKVNKPQEIVINQDSFPNQPFQIKNHHAHLNNIQIPLEFSQQLSPLISETCKPLFKLNIPFFTYSRFFNDSKLLYLSNDLAWVNYFMTNNLQNELDHLTHYIPEEHTKYNLWDTSEVDKVFFALREHFDYWHGITIYEKHDGFIDCFDFGAYKNKQDMVNFYFNNLWLLEQFIQFFKNKTFKLIHKHNLDSTKLLTSKIPIPFHETGGAKLTLLPGGNKRTH